MDALVAQHEFTYDLYKRANLLHRKKSFRVSLVFSICFVGFPVIAALAALFALWKLSSGDERAFYETITIFWPIAFYAGLVWLLRTLSFRRTYRNSFPKSLESRAMTLTFSEGGVHAVTSREVETNMPWASLCRVVSDDAMALLYYSRARFIPVPRSSFSGDDWSSFLALANQKLGGSKC